MSIAVTDRQADIIKLIEAGLTDSEILEHINNIGIKDIREVEKLIFN